VTSDQVVYTRTGQQYNASVVFYDPRTDIAVLDVPGLQAPSLQFAGPAPYEANAIVAGYPLNHPLTMRAARVGASINAYGLDIYESAYVTRQIYPLKVLVQPGNSGGPLVAPDGEVYGVVFAASTDENDVGYALTAAQVASDVRAGEVDTTPVSTEGCQG
jgi:S1-C subfamily serine protease